MISRLLALLLIAGVAFAQDDKKAAPKDTVVEAVIKEGRESCQVMDHLKHLTKKIGPRLTGSTRLQNAVEWAKGKFEEWGLKTQLDEWGTYPVAYDRTHWKGKMIAPEEKELTFGFNAWTAGTNGPVRGPAIMAPGTEEELDALKGKLKNAWVLSSGRATRGALADSIKKAYDEEGIAGMVRSSGGDLILTGGNPPAADKIPTRPNITMWGKHFNEVAALLKDGKSVELEFDIKVEFKKGPIKLYNVIADIPGTDKPDEYVIVGGHIDSWDGAEGCTDNGTGTVTTMEAARLLMKAGAKPKRTIRFMLWSGEEQGLLGSASYIRRNKDLLPKISAVLVHDGGTNYVSGISCTQAMKPIFETVFEPIIGLNENLPFKIGSPGPLPLGIGSDHDAFLQQGVPGFFWHQAKTKDKGQNYTHEHHTQYDMYEVAVPEFEQHTSMVAAIASYNIANLDALLPREGLTGGGGRRPRPGGGRMFGIQLGEGCSVTSVNPGSPADKAGMLEGDVILSVDGIKVSDQAELNDAKTKAKKTCKVVVKRGEKEVELSLTFDE